MMRSAQQMQQISEDTLVLILAGGRGSRLHEFTDKRAKPAVYFGGSWRIIDFPLSNCINSNLLKIGVITQYAAHSLLRHLQRGWSFLPYERNQFIDMLPARQQLDDQTWYRGTADAVYQNASVMQDHYRSKYVVILAGDHIYKMNYMQMLLDHIDNDARCTVACIEVPRDEAHQLGVMAVDENYRITDFLEKPEDPPAMPGRDDVSLASMGIYVFDADHLNNLLRDNLKDGSTQHDFGKDIIPQALAAGGLFAHPFTRSCVHESDEPIYWRDVGTLDSYWQANMDLIHEEPQLDLFDTQWPIRSILSQNTPTRYFFNEKSNAKINSSMIAGGNIIHDATIFHSVLFNDITVGEHSYIEESVILPNIRIGKNCVLKRCIIDRDCVIPDGMEIGVDIETDRARFRVSSTGKIVLVTEPMLRKLS
ncbi:glucose-1-phosphate adenylyltransferase [Suttonella sp. R2A3]|uniref:glucose-1-phosphate adenylyltransferase n=1 Tax=Suttonella sp. R2A3 TaxID=2908648 RepID=UPI001F285E9E|nr:glucose-1-phosphate adenylyltransferase [Suttonella sp. R2A3]UJF25025.1 glucose-1-phosphate adenylyltransferase [Suttonella sp. R2A3]